jgi:uncharacterized membrane protein YhdT
MNDELLTLAIVWLIAATVVAWIARAQGRSPVTWFGISILLTPVLAFVAVILTASPQKR